ncbi:MAG TPA: FliH/SctL family protein [Desulfobacterales bacterium]|nr:FliH/SctL family protein [Desulfobacterales bacterium]
MDSTCYLFPELLRKKSDQTLAAATPKPGFRRTGLGEPHGACGESRSGLPVQDAEQQAYCRGFGDGERKGREVGEQAGCASAMQKLDSLLTGAQKLIGELGDLHRKTCRDVESDLVQLALAVARKIVGREVSIGPEAVTRVIRQALERVEHAGRITIKLNPADLELLAEIKQQLLSGLPEAGRAAFEADAGITRGGCLIETDGGEVDARIERQFKVVEEAFRAEFEKETDRRERAV